MKLWSKTARIMLSLIVILGSAVTILTRADGEIASEWRHSGIREDAHFATKEDTLGLLIERGHAAVNAGDIPTAERIFHRVRASVFPWHSWAAASALVATYRMVEDFAGAYNLAKQIATEQPQLADLMSVWNGDTAILEGDLASARTFYKQVLYASPEVAALATKQLARLALLEGNAQEAAELKRDALRRFPSQIAPEFTLAEAMIFDAMEAGRLPLGNLLTLIHSGICTEESPCVLGRTEDDSNTSDQLQLASLSGLRFLPSGRDLEFLESARIVVKRKRPNLSDPLRATCTPSTASDGFQRPMAGGHSDYGFMEPTMQSYHPGVDLTDLGGGSSESGAFFVAVGRGCIRDASLSKWGSATIEHYYAPGSWISQYGCADKIYYSAGAAISKGARMGTLGHGEPGCCHLHYEIREADHPYREDSDYYSNSTFEKVGDWYQNPLPFLDAHRGYSRVLWVDEGAFKRYGTWNYMTGIGDRNDMLWAATTHSKANYARYFFSAPSSGSYELWSFVPYNHATSSLAKYKVAHVSTHFSLLSVTLDQLTHSDAWVRMGSIDLTANTRYYVEVASNTGELSRRVGLDDILLIKP